MGKSLLNFIRNCSKPTAWLHGEPRCSAVPRFRGSVKGPARLAAELSRRGRNDLFGWHVAREGTLWSHSAPAKYPRHQPDNGKSESVMEEGDHQKKTDNQQGRRARRSPQGVRQHQKNHRNKRHQYKQRSQREPLNQHSRFASPPRITKPATHLGTHLGTHPMVTFR